MYWKYFCYIVEHKWNVFIECMKAGLWIHGFTHDLSKFYPSEFIPYSQFFHSKDRTKTYKQSDETDLNFLKGWCLHQKRNKHHWNYWVSVTRKNEIFPIPMPKKYVIQMIADWMGMSRKFGDNPADYYKKNKNTFILHHETIEIIERHLGIDYNPEGVIE